jgi:heme/copper-type cytochrome/quinol oxidase subunit 3
MEDKNEQPKKEDRLKTIRTFSSDMAEAIRQDETSIIKIAMAEKEKREKESTLAKSGNTKSSKAIFFIGGLILIGIAIFGVYYFTNKKNQEENLVVKEKPRVETFVMYDNAIFLDISKTIGIMNLVSAIHSKENEEKSGINAVFLTKKNTEGVSETVGKSEFLSILKSTAPFSLTKSMSEKFLFGKYKGDYTLGNSTAFLIFEINDYNLAYASMLDWEKSIFADLFILFDITISESDTALFEKDWKDIIVNNKDARVLYGIDGEGLLFYSFVNKNTLVVTENEEILKRIINAILIKNPQ